MLDSMKTKREKLSGTKAIGSVDELNAASYG